MSPRSTDTRIRLGRRKPVAYPVFLTGYEADRQCSAAGTGIDGLYSIGRNGEFAHILLEDVYWRTLRAVDGFMASREDEAGQDGEQ